MFDLEDRRPINIQMLSISDWHGHVEPLEQNKTNSSSFSSSQIGGSALLASYWQREARSFHGPTLRFTAGDSFGATPLLSSSFGQTPAIEALRLMRVDANTFGNHDFDSGVDFLRKVIRQAADPKLPGKPFRFVCSNLESTLKKKTKSGNITAPYLPELPGVVPYVVFEVEGGVRVGVVGILSPEAASMVRKDAMGTLRITDTVQGAMEAQRRAREEGKANVVVCLVHMGVDNGNREWLQREEEEKNTKKKSNNHTVVVAAGMSIEDELQKERRENAFETAKNSTDNEPSGRLIRFAKAVSGFAVIFGDHTDVQWTGVINGQRVVECKSFGMSYSRIRLQLQRPHMTVLNSTVEFIAPVASPDVHPYPPINLLVAHYRRIIGTKLKRVVGITWDALPMPVTDVCGNQYSRCESELGDLEADAMLHAASPGAEIGIVNANSIRAPITCTHQTTSVCPLHYNGVITVGTLRTSNPFEPSHVVRAHVSRETLLEILEHSVSHLPEDQTPFVHISGLCVRYNMSAPRMHRLVKVVKASDAIHTNCQHLDEEEDENFENLVTQGKEKWFVIATNDFLATGGSGFPDLKKVASKYETLDTTLNALETFVKSQAPIKRHKGQGRFRCIGSSECPKELKQ